MAKNYTVDELWDYFCDNRRELADNLHLIANDEEQGVEIYITEEKGFPAFSVEVDGEEVYTVNSCSYIDAEKIYDTLLTTYIYPNSDYENIVDDDDERVREITGAVEDMLSTLLEADPCEAGISPQEIDEITSMIEEHLCDEYGFSIRHPTNVNGTVVQYPFGDPDENANDLPDIPDIIQ